MTVETRYVVVRDNTEVKIFVNKKEADEYDKLLDSADLIKALLEEGPINLTEKQCEEIGYYLAQNKEKVLSAFQMKKSPVLPSKL